MKKSCLPRCSHCRKGLGPVEGTAAEGVAREVPSLTSGIPLKGA